MFLKKRNFFDSSPGRKEEPIASAAEPAADAGLCESDTIRHAVNLCIRDSVIPEQIQLLENCCKDVKRKDLQGQLAALRTYLSSAKFTVAVVGEFNRGKSTLINRMIDSEILPSGIIPITDSLIYVSGGQDEIGFHDRHGEQNYPLEPDSWDQIEEEKNESELLPIGFRSDGTARFC